MFAPDLATVVFLFWSFEKYGDFFVVLSESAQ